MPTRDTTIKATIDIGARITDFQNAVKGIQDELNKLNVGTNVGADLAGTFKKVKDEIDNISRLTKNNELSLIDRKEVESTFNKLEKDWDHLIQKLGSKKITDSPLKNENKALVALKKLRDDYNAQIESGNKKIQEATRNYEQQQKIVQRFQNDYTKAQENEAKSKITNKINQDNLIAAEKQLNARKEEVKELAAAAEKAKELLAIQKEQQKAEEQRFNEQYMTEHTSRQGIKEARTSHMKDFNKQYEEAERTIEKYTQAIENEQKAYDSAKEAADRSAKALIDNGKAVEDAKAQWESAKRSLSGLKGVLTKLSNKEFSDLKNSLNLQELGIDPNTISSYNQLEAVIDELAKGDSTEAVKVVQNIKKYADQSVPAVEKLGQSIDEAGASIDSLTENQKQLDHMRNNILQFFSIGNAVQLFKRAIRSAVETVKDLDKVMTETAVVTEFSVGDMWTQLPEYTKRANELGVSIHDVYEASTLYYQQGLKTNEVMAVTNATLRMARIAGLEAAEATDRVTNALRGFNMKINEANADNIADVYSKLAAISASNVDEISTAMTKVASLANSANMSFENTAAFLAQIIETTRESAETAGTALKTVVARFSEVKDLYSKGELLGTDEEGEEIDVNKVSKALRTAGINLNEFLTGQKGLDAIFMELASKWDDLDIVQQRYIATMAAGSRQQSRFIALMSDYKRTQELTTAAQNANGASMEQYNKTLESVKTKTNRLKNAWNEFLMSIANSDFIKKAVDMLTNLVQSLNKVVNAISGGDGLLKSITAIGLSIGSLKLGRSIFNTIFGNPNQKGFLSGWITNLGKAFRGESSQISRIGASAGNNLMQGLSDSIKKNGGLANTLKSKLRKTFGNTVTAQDLGLETVSLDKVNWKLNPDKAVQTKLLSSAVFDAKQAGFTVEQSNVISKLNQEFRAGNIDMAEYAKQAKEAGVSLKITGEAAQQAGIKFQDVNSITNRFVAGMSSVGSILIMVASALDRFGGKTAPVAKGIRAMGMALMAFGAILPIVSRAIQAFAIDATVAIESIPIIGWIAAVISLLIGLGVAFHNAFGQNAEDAAKQAKEALDAATEAANEAADAVDNLSSSYEEIVNNANKLESLTKGTKEWQKAVEENNKAVLDLLASYRELSIVSNDGVLEITNYDEVMKTYEQRSKNAQVGVAGASLNYLEKNINASIEKAQASLSKVNYGTQLLSNSDMKDIAKAAANGTINDFLDAYMRGTGQSEEFRPDADKTETKEAYEIFRSLNAEIGSMDEQVESWRISVAASAVEYANLTDEQKEYANSLTNSTDVMNKFIREVPENYKNAGAYKDRFQQYVHETYGADVTIGSDGKFTVGDKDLSWETERTKFAAWDAATGEYVDYLKKATDYLAQLNSTNESLAKAYKGKNGEQLTANDLNEIKNTLEKSVTYMNENEEEVTVELNLDEAELTDLDDVNSDLYQRLQSMWNEDAKLQSAFSYEFEAWAKMFAENILTARDTFDQAYNIFNDFDEFETATEGFGAGVISELTQQLMTYKPDDTGEFGATIVESLKTLIGTETTGDIKKLEQVVSAFSKVALNSEDDLKDFKNTLSAMGFNVAESEFENFIDGIKKSITTLTQVDIKKIDEALPELAKIIENVESGEQTREFSKETYDKLKELGMNDQLMNDFIRQEDGSYLYLGEKLDNIVQGIKDQTSELLGEGRKQLEARSLARDIADDIEVAQGKSAYVTLPDGTQRLSYVETTQEEQSRDWLKQFVQGYESRNIDIGQIGVTGLQRGIDVERLTSDIIERMVSEAKVITANEAFYEDQLKELDDTEFTANLMTKTMDELIKDMSTTTVSDAIGEYAASQVPPEVATTYTEKAQQAVVKSIIAKAKNVPDKVLDQYVEKSLNNTFDKKAAYELQRLDKAYKQVADKGYDIDKILKYAQTLQDTYGIAIDEATQLALENTNLNQGLSDIIDSYDDWNNLIENGPLGKGADVTISFGNLEDQQAFETLKQNLQTTLNLNYELDDSFFQSAENIALLTQVAVGDAEQKQDALIKLAEAANQSLIDSANQTLAAILEDMEVSADEVTNFINWVNNLDMPNIEITSNLDTDTFIAQLNDMLRKAGAASKEIIEKLSLKQEYYQTGNYQDIAGMSNRGYTIGGLDRDMELQMNNSLNGKQGQVPLWGIRWVPDNSNKPDPTVTQFNKFGGRALNSSVRNKVPNSYEKANKDAKDAAEETIKLWKNPYDELYNLQEKVNDALREREQLEHRYEDMLKDHTKTSADLVENTYAEVAALKQQLQLNKQLLAGRKDQMSRVGNEMFEDSEGNRTTLAATGATKYAYYDESTGVVQIDYDAIDKITDENLGNAVEQYISRLEEIRDQINDTEDTIEDINDQLFDIQDRGKEEYLGFEQKVYDAIVNQRQKEIETLEKINDTVTDATNKTISTIQDEISKERQARENEETEQNILDKEMRLAYLQRDTSGANDLEIQKLQEEIANDQQSYQDSIIDQTIQEMQDEAERAAEQRQAQIDLLNYILEFDQQYGLIWDNVEDLLKSGIDNQGVIKTDSELYKLLDGDNSPLSQFGEEQWKIDLAKEIAIAMQGRTNYQLSAAKEQGTAQLTNGTVLTYNKASDKWTDKNGNEYTDLTWNLQANGFDATKHNKPQTKQPGSGNTGTGNNGGTGNKGNIDKSKEGKDTPETVTYTIQKNDGPWQVAQAVYGSATEANAQWQDVQSQLQAQGINELHPGQVVKIKRRYAQGGLADFTGPAWLDGTKSRPEMVLNAADTQNFITLKNILASILNNTQNSSKPVSSGDNYFDIDIQAEIDSDYDVDRLADRIKQQIAEDASYRNVNMISQMR